MKPLSSCGRTRRTRESTQRFDQSEHSSPKPKAGQGGKGKGSNGKENARSFKREKNSPPPCFSVSKERQKKVKIEPYVTTRKHPFNPKAKSPKAKSPRTTKTAVSYSNSSMTTRPPSQQAKLSPFRSSAPPPVRDSGDSGSDTTVTYKTPHGQATKPQEPGGCLSSDSDYESDVEEYDWKDNTWPRLQLAGWSYKYFNKKEDKRARSDCWWYIRPERNVKTGKVGEDIFKDEKSVVKFLKKKEERGDRKRSFTGGVNNVLFQEPAEEKEGAKGGKERRNVSEDSAGEARRGRGHQPTSRSSSEDSSVVEIKPVAKKQVVVSLCDDSSSEGSVIDLTADTP